MDLAIAHLTCSARYAPVQINHVQLVSLVPIQMTLVFAQMALIKVVAGSRPIVMTRNVLNFVKSAMHLVAAANAITTIMLLTMDAMDLANGVLVTKDKLS